MLENQTIDGLEIEDEASFRHVGLYGELKEVLRKSKYRFRVLPKASAGRWDRALFLNLTFWGASDAGDVLVANELPADVVTHVAWHYLTARALVNEAGAPMAAEELFLGEAIASAFDVYLVGRLLGHAPRSTFLANKVPSLADTASEAGLSEDEFDALLLGISDDPDRAFEDLRELLFDASLAISACENADAALTTLTQFDSHRFASLLHHFELSNWVLYSRAYAKNGPGTGTRARQIDSALRQAPVALDWLSREWVELHR